MKTIVLGYDDGNPAKRALERAVALAEAFGSQLIVTSVVPLLMGMGRAGPVDPVDTPADHIEELRHARAVLEAHGVTAEYVTAVGEPAETIIQLADERHADLVVVGTREPSVLERLFGQSISVSVSHRASCDVLIVH